MKLQEDGRIQYEQGDPSPLGGGRKLTGFGASLFSQFETRPGHTWPPEKCKLCNPPDERWRRRRAGER